MNLKSIFIFALVSTLGLVSCNDSATSEENENVPTLQEIASFGITENRELNHAHENKDNVAQLACDCIVYDLQKLGFEVKQGVAQYDESTYVPGYIFTTNNLIYYSEEDNYQVYEAGFFQIYDKGENTPLLTQESFENDAQAVISLFDSEDSLVSYDVSLQAMVDPFSGIFRDTYFKYVQTGMHTIEISCLENKIEAVIQWQE